MKQISGQVNWGMIGIGKVTEKKSGPAFSKVANSRLVAVMGRDAAKAAGYAARHAVARWYDDADALIADPEVNAVYIATPPDSHLDYTRRALRAGKAVYVEKPMALNAAECDEMNRISAETGVPLFVAYYRRAMPYFLKLKSLIDSGVIGQVLLIDLKMHYPPYPEETGDNPQPRWRVFPEKSGGGHFHDLASHQLDFLEYVFGPVKTARGIARNQAGFYPADDIVVAQLEFESGVLFSGSWCFTLTGQERVDETQIIGERGKISFPFFSGPWITVEVAGEKQVYEQPYPEHVQQPLLELIVKELRGEGKSPSTGLTGARANLIMDWITA